jgi:hypothetical protein
MSKFDHIYSDATPTPEARFCVNSVAKKPIAMCNSNTKKSLNALQSAFMLIIIHRLMPSIDHNSFHLFVGVLAEVANVIVSIRWKNGTVVMLRTCGRTG